MPHEVRIVGIDPGLAAVGWGYLCAERQEIMTVEFGCVRTESTTPLPERLHTIHQQLRALAEKYKPDALAIEQLIFSSNQLTAISVAQARGVAILAFAEMGVKVFEYSPPQIKQSVTGYGRATKEQVQKMLLHWLKIDTPPRSSHAADAVAAALCHLFHGRASTTS